MKIKWRDEPDPKDYVEAESYLALIYHSQKVSQLIRALQRAPVAQYKADNVFQASGLSLLDVSNYHVKKDRKKIKKGESLSPLLLIADQPIGKVIIADGYHRMCAVYEFASQCSLKKREWLHQGREEPSAGN